MTENNLFHSISPVAERQPKTDRLILSRYLEEAASDKRFENGALKAPYGRLVNGPTWNPPAGWRTERNQMQGESGRGLRRSARLRWPTDGKRFWHREQHYQIAGETPDAAWVFSAKPSIASPGRMIDSRAGGPLTATAAMDAPPSRNAGDYW